MKEITNGDIVVSMIAQSTNNDSCPIPMGYVSQALVDNGCANVLWFQETTSGEGAYHAENFRLATEEERQDYFKKGPYAISLDKFDFLPGDLVSTTTGIGRVVGLTKTNYLVKLDKPIPCCHNADHLELFIGSKKGLNCDGYVYHKDSLQKQNTIGISYNSVSNATAGIWASSVSNTIDRISGVSPFPLTGSALSLSEGTVSCTIINPASIGSIDHIRLTEINSNDTVMKVSHQQAIILKSNNNKRKLITI